MEKVSFQVYEKLPWIQVYPSIPSQCHPDKKNPDTYDFDNARYLLYKCSGGYPIGIFTMYVRSSIHAMGEVAKSQLIFAVGFNFYGDEHWQRRRKWVNKIWEWVHNRVTANVLNRIKQLGEWRIDTIKKNKLVGDDRQCT